MYKSISLLFLGLAVLLLGAWDSSAQEKILKGYVTTFKDIPLIGASVKVKSSKAVVLTDTTGHFSLKCLNEDVLYISAEGFYKEKVKITPGIKFAAINLKLKPGEKAREIAIGYGHINDREKLNAVAGINKDDIDFSQYRDIYEIIRGRFAGVQVMGNDIIIRGINSINSSSAALIVVDGCTVDSSVLKSIPTVEVKSINVIKDGSAAIYGSRGANGVVIIETRRGKE